MNCKDVKVSALLHPTMNMVITEVSHVDTWAQERSQTRLPGDIDYGTCFGSAHTFRSIHAAFQRVTVQHYGRIVNIEIML